MEGRTDGWLEELPGGEGEAEAVSHRSENKIVCFVPTERSGGLLTARSRK